MKTKTIIISLIGLSINFMAFSGENVQIMRCIHTTDVDVEDVGGIVSAPANRLNVCNGKVDGVHNKNLLDVGRVHINTHSEHCQASVIGSIGTPIFD